MRAVVLDQLDGSYLTQYTATCSGDYQLQIGSVQQGGLMAQYYENVWLFYAPAVQRVEHTLDHTWGLGKLTDASADYVSIRWTGGCARICMRLDKFGST